MDVPKAILIVAAIFVCLHILYYGLVTIDFQLYKGNKLEKAKYQDIDTSTRNPAHDIFPSSKNVTASSANILIYNRVPKCGSTTMGKAIEALAKKENFQYWAAKIYFDRFLTTDQQYQLLTDLHNMSISSSVCYNRHMYFFNDIRNDSGRITWMNLIRDPVERIISQFYYLRIYSIDREKQVLRWGFNPEKWFKMELNKCVAEGDPLCRYKAGDYQEMQLSYFCGQEKMCREVGNRDALQLAKFNVENYYAVVGVVEEMSLFFKVVRHYLPRFFRYITEVVSERSKLNTQPSKVKAKVSNETKIILRNCLKEDYELYEFICQRLNFQAKRIEEQDL